MYKRKPERKQLHQVDAKSPFFNGGAEIPRSPIEVGYAGEKSGGGNYQHNTRQTRKRGGYSCAPLGLITAWTLVLGGIGYFWLTSIRLPQQHLEFREKELEPVKHQWKQKVVLLEATLEDMERENKLLKASMDEDSKVLHIELQDVIGKLDRAKERVGVLEQSNREVEQRIRDFSRLAVLEKFGAGPHRVEIELNYPDNPETNWYIMLEMAPLDEMPHSIHMFLELVSRGLMDNGIVSFYTNAHHAILGAPFANHLTPRDVDNVEWRINDSGYAEVMFQEYSEKFPHQKYTVGFSGRPGGPSFYINMKDNTKNHGPRGFAADGKGDPCFAKVITGFDVVEKMNQASGELKEGEWKDMMAGPIAVRSMKYIK